MHARIDNWMFSVEHIQYWIGISSISNIFIEQLTPIPEPIFFIPVYVIFNTNGFLIFYVVFECLFQAIPLGYTRSNVVFFANLTNL